MKPLHFLPLTAIVTVSFSTATILPGKDWTNWLNIECYYMRTGNLVVILVSGTWIWPYAVLLRILSVPPAVVLKKPGSCCMLIPDRGFWIFLLGAKQCDWVTPTGKWSKTWILIWSCVLRDEDHFFHVLFKSEIWKTEHLCSVVDVGVSYLSLKMLH